MRNFYTILKLAKAGQWLPNLSTVTTQNLSEYEQKCKSLQETLMKYQREKVSWEHVLPHPAPYQDDVYLASCRNELAAVKQHIHETLQLLAELKQDEINNKESSRAGI